MGATFDGQIWTRYIARSSKVGEWRLLNKYRPGSGNVSSRGHAKYSNRLKVEICVPMVFARKNFNKPTGPVACQVSAGRFTLQCFLGRTLESWEVCRHGIAGPNDHSYLNVSPGDAVNNMIDDLENGKSETNLTYLIQAQQRLSRLISNLTSTQPTDAA